MCKTIFGMVRPSLMPGKFGSLTDGGPESAKIASNETRVQLAPLTHVLESVNIAAEPKVKF
jgi:hypothetical protein